MARRILSALIVGAALMLLPAVVSAQSAINGTVKDTSGAVLPGVTVEASSDVLIEKVRSVVTDERGVYGSSTCGLARTRSPSRCLASRRSSARVCILPAEFTATINAELEVGELDETITVTGESPVVDVTTAVHTPVLDREAIDAIPTGRSIQGMAQLIVGINLNLPDTGGARAMQQTYMSTHGMTAANNTVLVDGMMVNGLQADGAVQSYFNDAMNRKSATRPPASAPRRRPAACA